MQACEVYHRHGMDDSIADGTAHTDSDTSWPTWNMVRRVRQVSYHHKSFHLVYLPFCCCNYCICVQYWYRKVKENWCKIKKVNQKCGLLEIPWHYPIRSHVHQCSSAKGEISNKMPKWSGVDAFRLEQMAFRSRLSTIILTINFIVN